MAMLAMSCSNSDSVEAPQSGEVTVTFNVANYEQIDMDDAETRSTAITNLYWLTLGIYDANTLQLVTDTVTQYYTSSDFGTFSVTLPYGEYKVLVLGYTNTRQPDMSDPTAIVFTDNFVPNLFSNNTLDLTVDATTEISQTILLSRVVAAFRIHWEDATPATISGMYIVMEGGSYKLNSLTGYADKVETRTYDVDFAESDHYLTLYSFLTEESATMDITMTAYDGDGAEIVTHRFTDVPMKINQFTQYTGNFFTLEESTGGFTVELAHDFDWENEVDYTYNFSDY